jgi:hypothetical protein
LLNLNKRINGKGHKWADRTRRLKMKDMPNKYSEKIKGLKEDL